MSSKAILLDVDGPLNAYGVGVPKAVWPAKWRNYKVLCTESGLIYTMKMNECIGLALNHCDATLVWCTSWIPEAFALRRIALKSGFFGCPKFIDFERNVLTDEWVPVFERQHDLKQAVIVAAGEMFDKFIHVDDDHHYRYPVNGCHYFVDPRVGIGPGDVEFLREWCND